MKNLRFGIACALVCSMGSGFAAEAKKAPKAGKDAPFMAVMSDAEQEAAVLEYTKDLKGWTDAELDAYANQPASKFNRKIASDGLENTLANESEFVELRESILRLRTGKDVANALEKLTVGYYDGLKSKNAKLVALELAQLKPLRGIIFRLVPIVQGESDGVHSALLTRVMKIATRIGIYQPTTQAPAIFQYLTEPYAGITQFKTVGAFQNYVLTHVSKEFELSRARLSRLDVSTPLVLDNELAFHATDPNSRFETPNRYNLFQEGEKRLLLALKARTLKNQMVFVSFELNDLVKMVKSVGRISGFDGAVGDIDGTPKRVIVEEIRKFDKLFRFKPTPGRTTMHNAAFYNAEMVASLVAARAALKMDKGSKDESDTSRIFNMAALQATTFRMDKVLDVWKSMIRKPTSLVSKRTGEPVSVDVPGFWDMYSLRPDHPAMKARKPGEKDDKDSRYNTVWDSKNFLPTGFVGDGNQSAKYNRENETGKFSTRDGFRYRNYQWGMPGAWNAKIWDTLFPNVTNEGVGDAQRILKESDGGRLVANLIDWVID